MMSEAVRDALLVFTPSGKRGRFAVGTPVLQAARQLGVDIDSICGGRGICGRCKVVLSTGEFAKHGITSEADNLSELSAPEQRYATSNELAEGARLSCHTKLLGDAVIDVPVTSQVHPQVVRKEYESHDVTLAPCVRLHYVEVTKPSLDRPRSDELRLLDALEHDWQLEAATCAPHVLPTLQQRLREGAWQVTAAVRDAEQVIALSAGFESRALGVAVDVGSTTIAAHLCDLTTGDVLASAGVMNPQIRFGEDLMSRVSYLMLNPGGEAEMTRVVREALDQLLGQLCEDAEAERQQILELTFVGNPIMHHLLLGISPIELGTAPFALATEGAVSLPARDLDLDLQAGARAYVLPCIAGHVGADTAAMLLAEAPWESEAISLLVDVGTNAEIVLGNAQRLLAASSPTGPAFEGAQISCGQRAAPGAIERVRIDPTTLEPRFKVIGCEAWSDEPAFAAEVEKTGITGLCGTGIIEAIAELFLAGVIDSNGLMNGALAERSPRVVAQDRTFSYVLSHALHEGAPDVRIVQNDVRAIQLAKGALYAGIRLLMDRFGAKKVDRIRLAGAFGSHIDVKYAMLLGMIPDCDLEHVSAAGNAAGTGAITALLDVESRHTIESRVRSVEKIETAVETDFQRHFVEAMAIPHGSDPFPELAKHVALPSPTPAADPTGPAPSGRRRTRRGRAAKKT